MYHIIHLMSLIVFNGSLKYTRKLRNTTGAIVTIFIFILHISNILYVLCKYTIASKKKANQGTPRCKFVGHKKINKMQYTRNTKLLGNWPRIR